MRDDANEDMRADASDDDESVSGETEQIRQSGADQVVSQGRDVHDTSRHGTPHGRDVLGDEEPPEVETHGAR